MRLPLTYFNFTCIAQLLRQPVFLLEGGKQANTSIQRFSCTTRTAESGHWRSNTVRYNMVSASDLAQTTEVAVSSALYDYEEEGGCTERRPLCLVGSPRQGRDRAGRLARVPFQCQCHSSGLLFPFHHELVLHALIVFPDDVVGKGYSHFWGSGFAMIPFELTSIRPYHITLGPPIIIGFPLPSGAHFTGLIY